MKITPISAEAANAGALVYELYLDSIDALELMEHVETPATIDAATLAMDEARMAYDEYLSLLRRRQ